MDEFEINLRLAREFWPDHKLTRDDHHLFHNGKKVDYRNPAMTQRLIYAMEFIQFNKGPWPELNLKEGEVMVNGVTAPTLAKAVALAYFNHEKWSKK